MASEPQQQPGLRQRVRDWFAVVGRVVNPLGWIVLFVMLVAFAAARMTGWRELDVLALACLVLLALALPFLWGRTRIAVDFALEPKRLIAGGSVSAAVGVRNAGTRRIGSVVLELPVGGSVQRYALPPMPAGHVHQETFTIRTDRRAVIAVGPATTRRGDALGLFSRDAVWTEVEEVFVRPPMAPLEALGAGLLRDLEGVSTDAVSQSDLAFHALREYQAGDDLRHVHWRSSAKAMGAGDSKLLVRQYLDTRRSHATVVVDDTPDAWTDADAYETAMSVAASVIVRAVLDEFEASFVSGDVGAGGEGGNRALDAVCRAEPGKAGLVEGARRANRMAPDTSLLFLVSGAGTGIETLLLAAAAFPPEVRRIAVVIDPDERATARELSGVTVLSLPSLDELPQMLHWSVR